VLGIRPAIHVEIVTDNLQYLPELTLEKKSVEQFFADLEKEETEAKAPRSLYL